MTTLQHHVPAPISIRSEEHQALDNYVLAARIVHRAETLLAAAGGNPEAVTNIEAAFAIALSITADSSWTEVRAGRRYLDAAQDALTGAGYWLR